MPSSHALFVVLALVQGVAAVPVVFHDARLDTPTFKAKVAAERMWLDSLTPQILNLTRPAMDPPSNSTSIISVHAESESIEETVVVCSENQDNPLSCSFTAQKTQDYYFVFSTTTVASVIAPKPIGAIFVGKKVYEYWSNCCNRTGGSGSAPCKWTDVEVLHYTAKCTGTSGYNGMAINLYLRSGEGVNILIPGGKPGFF